MQQQQHIRTIDISSGASGASDSGLQIDVHAKYDKEIRKYSEMFARYSLPEVVIMLCGLIPYEFEECYGFLETECMNFEKYPDVTVDQQEMYHRLVEDSHDILRSWDDAEDFLGFKKCKRCFDEISPKEFYDDGMCAYCLEEVHSVNIDNCSKCREVNFLNENGICIVCDYEKE